MTDRKTRKRDDPEQSKLFLAKAAEIEADEANSNADSVMGRLAATPPQPKPKPKGQRPK